MKEKILKNEILTALKQFKCFLLHEKNVYCISIIKKANGKIMEENYFLIKCVEVVQCAFRVHYIEEIFETISLVYRLNNIQTI